MYIEVFWPILVPPMFAVTSFCDESPLLELMLGVTASNGLPPVSAAETLPPLRKFFSASLDSYTLAA